MKAHIKKKKLKAHPARKVRKTGVRAAAQVIEIPAKYIHTWDADEKPISMFGDERLQNSTLALGVKSVIKNYFRKLLELAGSPAQNRI